MKNHRGLLWIGAIGASASLTVIIFVIAVGATTAQAEQCWDPGYTGGFSWIDGEAHHYGWHTAHATDTACAATLHNADCGCGWCAGGHARAADGCPCPWCAAERGEEVDTEAVDATAGWHAHGADCGCGWCTVNRDAQAGRADWPDARIGSFAHDGHCGCGWCMGHSAAANDDGSWTGHGPGCCCGWCSSHAATDGNPPVAPAHSHCGCGCC